MQPLRLSLVTSQNVTAPKLDASIVEPVPSLVTSQNVTAPKQGLKNFDPKVGLVTSQNVTAPKLVRLQP